MGSSLNNAFARAYAKDHLPAHAADNLSASEMASNRTTANPRCEPSPSLADYDIPIPPSGNINTAYVAPQITQFNAVKLRTLQNPIGSQSTVQGASHTSVQDFQQVEELRRRLDQAAAAAPPAPHLSPRPHQSVTVAASPKTNSLTRRMQISQPAAPQPQTPSWQANTSPLQSPKLSSNDNPYGQSDEDLAARRKQVADYLYTAGQEMTAHSRMAAERASYRDQSDIERLMSSSIVDVWGSSGATPAETSEMHVRRPTASEASSVGSAAYESAPALSTSTSAVSMQPLARPSDTARQPIAHDVKQRDSAPAIVPGALPSDRSRSAPKPLPAVTRPGEFLRVDIPVHATQPAATYTYPEQPARNAPMQPPAVQPQPMQQPTAAQPPLMMTAKAEEQLRQAKTRVFNPVWEVDELQWPEVCLQLMQKRAANLADIAKHLKSACQDGLQVLGIASAQSGEGVSTVANCLAMLCGQHGMKVVLIDGNMEAPSLCAQTNLEIDSDWRAAIIEQMPLEEVAVHSIADQLTLVPLHKPEQPDQLLASDQRIAAMIRELADSFDLVIVDVGPVQAKSALITNLSRETVFDAAMIVVDRRRTAQQSVDSAVMRVRNAGVSSIGIIENFAA